VRRLVDLILTGLFHKTHHLVIHHLLFTFLYPPMNLRYSTWQAVSSKAQAGAEKVSLKVQLEACTKAGQVRGWRHVTDYSVPGKTRTQWISLYHAEKHIPELHAMLESASRREFDVLVIYDLNRFRDLMRQIFDVLCDCGIQLYILSDPREPVAPSEYTDERKNEVGLTVGLRDIISRSEITSLRKHYRDKMPKRITDRRLHAGLGLPPYGYRKPDGQQYDRSAVLIQIPEQVRVLKQIKDWFLAGTSLTSIAERLNTQKIPSPRGRQWWYSIIAYLLANPFYAGIVSFGSTERIRNRREGTVTRRKHAPVTAEGLHKPIWDLATHRRIKDELEKRGKAHPGIRTRQLSRILHCWCGGVLWAQTTPEGSYWRCSSLQPRHAYIRDDHALERVTDEVVQALQNLDELKLPTPEDNRADLQAERTSLLAKQKRWMDLYEDGTLSKDALTERISAIQTRIQSTDELIQRTEETLTRVASTRNELEELAANIASFPIYVKTRQPLQVNAYLRRILARAVVAKDKTVHLEWR
jgi:site-specific DNA recombinase